MKGILLLTWPVGLHIGIGTCLWASMMTLARDGLRLREAWESTVWRSRVLCNGAIYDVEEVLSRTGHGSALGAVAILLACATLSLQSISPLYCIGPMR